MPPTLSARETFALTTLCAEQQSLSEYGLRSRLIQTLFAINGSSSQSCPQGSIRLHDSSASTVRARDSSNVDHGYVRLHDPSNVRGNKSPEWAFTTHPIIQCCSRVRRKDSSNAVGGYGSLERTDRWQHLCQKVADLNENRAGGKVRNRTMRMLSITFGLNSVKPSVRKLPKSPRRATRVTTASPQNDRGFADHPMWFGARAERHQSQSHAGQHCPQRHSLHDSSNVVRSYVKEQLRFLHDTSNVVRQETFAFTTHPIRTVRVRDSSNAVRDGSSRIRLHMFAGAVRLHDSSNVRGNNSPEP